MYRTSAALRAKHSLPSTRLDRRRSPRVQTKSSACQCAAIFRPTAEPVGAVWICPYHRRLGLTGLTSVPTRHWLSTLVATCSTATLLSFSAMVRGSTAPKWRLPGREAEGRTYLWFVLFFF